MDASKDDVKWVRANDDKPHRCPRCHRIDDALREQVHWWTIGHCVDCRVRWSMAEARLMQHRLRRRFRS